MSGFMPTEQQMKFFDLIGGGWKLRDTETGNIAIDAVAGSGKTTTAVRSIPYAARRFKRIGFTAFSKEIARTLQERAGSSCIAGTMHSMGLKLVRDRFGDVGAPNNLKYLDICKAEFPSWFSTGTKGFKRIRNEFAAFQALTKIVREQNIAIESVTTDKVKKIANICGQQGISLPSLTHLTELVGGVFRCLEIGADNPKSIDFGDMVWLPVHHKMGVDQFDLIYGDEAQDFNPIQQALFMQLGEKKVIIGDPFQSIMGFSGADCQSFKNLTNWLNARVLPLSVCWRCPKSHLDLARVLVPHIEASPNAIQGEIDSILLDRLVATAEPKDMILSRANAPLVGVAYRLLQSGKPAIVRGKNIGDGIIGLVEKLQPFDMHDLNVRVGRWKEREIQKLVERDASQESFKTLDDQTDCIKEMASSFDTVDEFISGCQKLFGDDNDTRPDQVILSSAHRAKGLEAKNITILQPSKFGAWGETEEAYQQELNLLYVALTRAQSSLKFCGSFGSGSEEGGLHGWLAAVASRKSVPSNRKLRF